MSESWTERAYKATEPMWARLYNHPFITELREGTLANEKLVFYFEQNLHYIEAVVQCRSIAAAKARTDEERSFFLDRTPVVAEELRHQQAMVTALGGRADAPLAPACHGYTRHILNLAWTREPVEYFGAFLPCPWSYDEIGRGLKGLMKNPAHLDWWEFYMSQDHNDMCDRYRAFVDKHAAGLSEARRAEMIENFRTSLRYEWRFWNMAYTLEQWEI
jgi:thiaminase (transcriptional activator TenA)